MKLFVYGSLKAGFGNNRHLGESKFIGTDKFKGGVMYSLGYYPGVVDGNGVIHGEVYRISSKTLDRLDRLEGHPNFYERRAVKLESGKNAMMYFYRGQVAHRDAVPDGNWQRR